MKRPAQVPTLQDLLQNVSPDQFEHLVTTRISSLQDNRYLHWDQIKRRNPPAGLDHTMWWAGIKLARHHQYREIPLQDANGRPFKFGMPDPVLEMLHQIDSRAAGRIAFSEQVTDPESRDRYIVNSLIEESIQSSQLEGASTTKKVASGMLRSGRKPLNNDERMILNNYIAMSFIREIKDRRLTSDLVLQLHKTVSEGTLTNPDAAGRLQTPAEKRVAVYDHASGKTLHTPPPAKQLGARLKALSKFANTTEYKAGFIHPVLKAIILHFWIGFDHPFEDGNGRTARALFYWSVLHNHYWLFEYISISRNIKTAPAKYGYAYLYSETDDNDLTYFLIQQLEVIIKSIDDLEKYLKNKMQQIKNLEAVLRDHTRYNHRELALLSHALRKSNTEYTVKSHQRSHNIAYATARADLLHLEKEGLLIKKQVGKKTFTFYPPRDFEERINAVK